MDTSSKFKESLPITPEMLFQKLETLSINFAIFEHPPLFTVDDAKKHQKHMTGLHVKNLLLRDKKKENF